MRSRVMGPEQALADQYAVLLIDDVCSFLTPRLVRSLRESGREIIGVYNPIDGPDAKRRLLECGITDVIESEAPAEEFVSVIDTTLLHHRPDSAPARSIRRSFRVGVLGPIGGVGVTEVAIGVAAGLSSTRSTVLVDLDLHHPSVAQRLDLPLHPNLMTAIDAAHHSGDVDDAILEVDRLAVIGGLSQGSRADLSMIEIESLLDEVGRSGHEIIVADLGAVRTDRLPELWFDLLIFVGLGSPVGMARLVRAVRALPSIDSPPDIVTVVNRTGAGHRRLEIRSELARLIPDVPVVMLPDDRRLERAAWDGVRPERGPFARSVERIASLIEAVAP
ncbi:MAG TPA: hypothetical protein VIC07_09375 [Acidimicrobiia bacterium]